MPVETSMRGAEKNVQDWINLVCGVLLFISPWALGFAGDQMAARTAWIGGIVFFVLAVAALEMGSSRLGTMRIASPRSASSGVPAWRGGACSILRTITTLLTASPCEAGTSSGAR